MTNKYMIRLFTRLSLVNFLFITLILTIGFFESVQADDLVTCRYLSSQGKKIVLELDIGSPAPSMVIVVQRIPKGILIIQASPKIKKFDSNKGEAKWLLSNVRPGRSKMAMSLSESVRNNEVRGEIRYKNPVTGKMVTMPIMP